MCRGSIILVDWTFYHHQPHEVARTRLREQARSGIFKYNGMWSTIRLIAREEGKSGKDERLFGIESFTFIFSTNSKETLFVTGLYAGLGVHLMKVVPNSAIMFLTYEVVNSWLSQVNISD